MNKKYCDLCKNKLDNKIKSKELIVCKPCNVKAVQRINQHIQYNYNVDHVNATKWHKSRDWDAYEQSRSI